MKQIYKKENLQEIISSSSSMTESILKLGLRAAGGNYKTLHKYIKLHSIDISHFKEEQKEKMSLLHKKNRKPDEEVFVKDSNHKRGDVKNRLYVLGLKERYCELCGQGEEWCGKKMSLILDHINGVFNDNRIINLRIVCPNCNATLPTHCGKNNSKRSKKKEKYGFSLEERVDFRKVDTEEKLIYNLKRRKVERPPLEILLKEVKDLGYSATGRKYGVSDNAIRKWIKNYSK